jgi:hypothetical protein
MTEPCDRISKHPLYGTWTNMICRCYRETASGFEYYGGRGITVCSRWMDGEDDVNPFLCFVEDMGPRPDKHTLDRIETDGNYEPSNCRWATYAEQAANRRPRSPLNKGRKTEEDDDELLLVHKTIIKRVRDFVEPIPNCKTSQVDDGWKKWPAPQENNLIEIGMLKDRRLIWISHGFFSWKEEHGWMRLFNGEWYGAGFNKYPHRNAFWRPTRQCSI